MITNFDIIKNMTVEQLATYLHNLQESAIKNNKVDNVNDWEMFLNKEAGK